ncbi:alanine racemase [Rhodohalobacter sp. 8-1]|uniref:alanine racemase n=1 Tax=Rhodohalobacter sp. 8-1 TaxID=3131972 RepID=UPI0030EC05B7
MAKQFLRPSYIELDRSALENNLQFIKSNAANGLRISSVIKGNAYGHGISNYLPIAEKCGIDHFSVFCADEAAGAFKYKTKESTDIMIMGMIRNDELKWAIDHGIEFYLFEKDRLESAIEAASEIGKKARIHLQIETGMNRTGFEEDQWHDIFKRVKSNKDHLDLRGICTHYAGAESVANYYRVQNQDKAFRNAIEVAKTVFYELPTLHASSSAAFLTYPDMHYDMVRIGIAQYGFWPSRETYMHVLKQNNSFTKDPLIRVLNWKSEIMSTKWVGEGEFIGYGNVFMTSRKMRIATVPIGYSHGFGRNLTNAGYVLIKGDRARVVGLVNMNMLTVEITDMPDAKKGDEVVIIGKQNGQEITVASFGEMSNNLNYEVLTRLPARIPREVLGI